jgi:hypothetical protein
MNCIRVTAAGDDQAKNEKKYAPMPWHPSSPIRTVVWRRNEASRLRFGLHRRFDTPGNSLAEFRMKHSSDDT